MRWSSACLNKEDGPELIEIPPELLITEGTDTCPKLKHWEIIADNLHKAWRSYGYVSALDREGRTSWIVDAHGYGKRFIVRADEMLTAFVELQRGYTRSR